MDPSHNFPPSPREMYMYQPAQRVNGHKVQSPSPTRGRPPPVLPERKPETQLSNRASRPSLSSLDSASFDVASPPHSPGYHGHKPIHHGQSHYPDNKPFSYAAVINSQQASHKHGVHEDTTRVKLHRDASPRNQRGNVVSEGHDIQRYTQPDEYASQNTATIYQRIDRNRTVSTPDTLLTGEHDCYDSDPFHTYDSFGQSEGIYGQFVQPSNGSHHRPSLTYVPPPVVPTLPEFGKIDKPAVRDQHSHTQDQQQPKVVNKNASPSMPLDAASPHNHHVYHHPHKHHHHTHQQHDQSQVVSRHHSHHSPSSSSSPLVSPKRTNSARMKSKPDKLPQPPSIPVPPPPPPPPPPAPVHDKHVSAVTNTRTPSPPLPPPPSEPGFTSKTRSSKKRIEPCPQSPLASHSKNADTQPHQLCMSGPALHHHHHHPHQHHQHDSLVGVQPTDLPQNNHHQVKAPTAQAPPPPPPPPPPLRTSSTPQILPNHHPDLNSAPAGIRSPRSGSPARHHIQKQTSLATIDDLVQIKLRTVSDSTPSSPVLSPVMASDISSGAINVKLRPTPGKFRNIYAEDETTLPPPPPIDDLDELPPPPPPPELLSGDLGNLSFNSSTHQKQHSAPPAAHPNQLHCPPGEADSLHIDHRLVQQQQSQRQPVSTPKAHNQDSAGSKAGAGASSKPLENTPSSLGQLISECVSSMDFDIPDDIDLSQCPGLVEINKSTPNWKKDMIEKKNQERIEEYVKAILKEREQQAKWKNVPEWKRKILQKKEEEDAAAAAASNQPVEAKTPAGKKPGKKAPVPPPKEVKEDPAQPKPKGDIVPAALSIDPEELAAMPPWKQELLFKRGKVPVTFSNEYNPDEEEKADNETVPAS